MLSVQLSRAECVIAYGLLGCVSGVEDVEVFGSSVGASTDNRSIHLRPWCGVYIVWYVRWINGVWTRGHSAN
jgi:hypothetical protein